MPIEEGGVGTMTIGQKPWTDNRQQSQTYVNRLVNEGAALAIA